MKKLIIASTSTVYGMSYLEYLLDELDVFYTDVKEILFIPYARPGGITHDKYTDLARQRFEKLSKEIKGIHSFNDPVEALTNAQGVFVGGGNTFLLVHQLYNYNLMESLRKVVLNGTPYLGTSAGANITGETMQTTNDMPVIYPQSFKTLGLVPFNINPHYKDSDTASKHMGETRETRIKEFHKFNSIPVVGLREGSWIQVTGDDAILKGEFEAKIFEQNKTPYELKSGSTLKF